eukprot:scaffold68316_cov59-Phaeocystis_antarctica.AAC.8
MSSLFSSLMGGKVKQSAGAQLLERMSSATQLEDKREALSEFKGAPGGSGWLDTLPESSPAIGRPSQVVLDLNVADCTAFGPNPLPRGHHTLPR